MFYYKDKEDNWHKGLKVMLPNKKELNSKNKKNSYGWEWHEEPPKEYLEWIEKQENNANTY